MARTRITFTNDTSGSRALHVGSDVVWYVYLRATTTTNLYLQRSVAGVFDPETLIAEHVDYVDTIVDSDNARAWIYFVSDEALRAIEVTDKTELPTYQFYQRSPGWNERVESMPPGAGFDGFFGFTDLQSGQVRQDDGPVEIYPPLLALADDVPGQQILMVTPSQVTTGAINKFRVYRNTSIAGAGWQFWSDLPYSPLSTLIVPAPVYPAEWFWVATAIRYQNYKESAWSNVVSSNDAGEVLRSSALRGVGFEGYATFVDKTPVKLAPPAESYAPSHLRGVGFEGYATFVDKTPIKLAAPVDSYAPGKLRGGGFDFRFSLNGVDPIAP
jgi:hypothetical protein